MTSGTHPSDFHDGFKSFCHVKSSPLFLGGRRKSLYLHKIGGASAIGAHTQWIIIAPIMKTVVLGDVHGRLIWKRIIEIESDADRIIFLGDYVSTHYMIPASRQLKNLDDILDYKEANSGKVFLLRGNHDMQHLGYPWGRCSGFDHNVAGRMPKERYLRLTQWAFIDDDSRNLYSHAGVSEVWMRRAGVTDVHGINAMPPSELFGFSLADYPRDNYGTSPTQPPTWIRPDTLVECGVAGWNQIVGHTPMGRLYRRETVNGDSVWLCDALEERQYLVVEDNAFTPKEVEPGVGE